MIGLKLNHASKGAPGRRNHTGRFATTTDYIGICSHNNLATCIINLENDTFERKYMFRSKSYNRSGYVLISNQRDIFLVWSPWRKSVFRDALHGGKYSFGYKRSIFTDSSRCANNRFKKMHIVYITGAGNGISNDMVGVFQWYKRYIMDKCYHQSPVVMDNINIHQSSKKNAKHVMVCWINLRWPWSK